jgi:hypothetical protein
VFDDFSWEGGLRNRDLALIGLKGAALWVIISGLVQALEVALNWAAVEGQFASMNMAPGSPSPKALVWNALGAFFARSGIGLILWFLAPLLSRNMFPGDDPPYSTGSSLVMYRAAAFFVGLWLLADALPLAATTLVWVMRAHWRPTDAGGVAQLASLWVKLGLGFALIRGGDWVREWFVATPEESRPEPADE